jgi:adenylate kinase family enzyme
MLNLWHLLSTLLLKGVIMKAYLITGPSGSGKNTIMAELYKRGYKIVETDSTFGYWANIVDETPIKYPGNKNLTEDWIKEH